MGENVTVSRRNQSFDLLLIITRFVTKQGKIILALLESNSKTLAVMIYQMIQDYYKGFIRLILELIHVDTGLFISLVLFPMQIVKTKN